MALWTPYAEEALDLSRAVKEDRISSNADKYYYTQPVEYKYVLPTEYVPQVSPGAISWYSKTSPSPPQSPELYEVDSLSDDVEYQAFERDALRAMAEKNGGSLLGNNPRMRRSVQSNQVIDDGYKKQRERNNFAAKQSRDRRKLREVRLAFQVTFLKKKLAAMRVRLADRYCLKCQQQCRC